MMYLMLALIELAIAGVFIFHFLHRAEPWEVEDGEGSLSILRKRRDRVLRAIKDIEFEHEAGVLSEEEYERLRRDFKAQGIVAMRELEELRDVRVERLDPEHQPSFQAMVQEVEGLVSERRKQS